MLQQTWNKDDQIRHNCAELSTYLKQLTSGRTSYIFLVHLEWWVCNFEGKNQYCKSHCTGESCQIKHQTIFNKSMKECLISRLSKHLLLIPHAKIGANICQKYCSKLSYWPPGGLGLKSCDHVQVRYLESALIEDRSWNWERNKFCDSILTFNTTFCQ